MDHPDEAYSADFEGVETAKHIAFRMLPFGLAAVPPTADRQAVHGLLSVADILSATLRA